MIPQHDTACQAARIASQKKLSLIRAINPALGQQMEASRIAKPAAIDRLAHVGWSAMVDQVWAEIQFGLITGKVDRRWELGPRFGTLTMTDDSAKIIVQWVRPDGMKDKRLQIAEFTGHWQLIAAKTDLGNLLRYVLDNQASWAAFKKVAFTPGGGGPVIAPYGDRRNWRTYKR